MWYSILKGQYHIEFGLNLAKSVVYFLTTPLASYSNSRATSLNFHGGLLSNGIARSQQKQTLGLSLRNMGTVHGVYLKYVGLSALSYAGYSYLLGNDGIASDRHTTSLKDLLQTNDVARIAPVLYLGYSTLLNGVIAVLFKLEKGMALIGKDPSTGAIPLWSYVVFAPFHLPTMAYTHFHTSHGTQTFSKENGSSKKEHVPVASLVQPGWFVGGCYAHQLNKEWACVIDLTVEFPESCISRTKEYLSVPTWDGVPCSPEQLESTAVFAVNARKKHGGDVLVHCAHGRGRSTTVMCACLVKEGIFETWEEAFERGIKPGRPVCKLNKRMRQNLTKWQAAFVDDRKGK